MPLRGTQPTGPDCILPQVAQSSKCMHYPRIQDRVTLWRWGLFIGGAALCLTPFTSPATALALGLLLALSIGNPAPRGSKALGRRLLQISVVLLGFTMEIAQVLRSGARGLTLGAATIFATLLLGAALARYFKVTSVTAALISAGTAICGGSAIAAVAAVIAASEAEVSIALGTVFVLNAAALYIFPLLGELLALNPEQFGTLCGIAIHDISSVVGAASQFGPISLETATTVKLSRALWIAPVALAIAWCFRRPRAGSHRALQIPWFIALFLAASALRSWVPALGALAPSLSIVARAGFTLTLFLIGASISRDGLRAVGAAPLLLGVALWLFISSAALAGVFWGL